MQVNGQRKSGTVHSKIVIFPCSTMVYPWLLSEGDGHYHDTTIVGTCITPLFNINLANTKDIPKRYGLGLYDTVPPFQDPEIPIGQSQPVEKHKNHWFLRFEYHLNRCSFSQNHGHIPINHTLNGQIPWETAVKMWSSNGNVNGKIYISCCSSHR